MFTCPVCRKQERYEPYAEPRCCHQLMQPGQELYYTGGDPEEYRIDVLKLWRNELPSHFQELDVDKVGEVWFLKPGRQKGERIGWLVEGKLAWQWYMVPGVNPGEGVALDRVEALDAMISALDRG